MGPLLPGPGIVASGPPAGVAAELGLAGPGSGLVFSFTRTLKLFGAGFSYCTAVFGRYRTSPAGGGAIGYHVLPANLTLVPSNRSEVLPLGNFTRRMSRGMHLAGLPGREFRDLRDLVFPVNEHIFRRRWAWSGVGSSMNCVAIQLTEPYGAVYF